MHRDSYVFAHICDRFGDGLFDPSGRVGGEFEFFVRVEFFDGFD